MNILWKNLNLNDKSDEVRSARLVVYFSSTLTSILIVVPKFCATPLADPSMDSAAAIAVDSVLHKIQALLEDESLAESMPAFGRNMAGIQSSLESMKQSFVTTQLVDHPPGSPIWTWMRDLRERAYDVEDQIDRFMIANGSPPSPSVRLQKHGFKGLLQRTNDLLSNVKARRRLSGDIQKHKDHVLQLHAVLPSLAASPSTRRTDDVDCGSSSVHNTPIQALAAGEVTVGLDGPRDELIKLLMVMESESESESESAARLKVVSVVGSGGMGKTTLTQHVYSTIGPHFHCRAWVVVSQMNIREILTDLLRQVCGDEEEEEEGKCDERHLVKKIRESLHHRRYLLVLDDLWSLEAWETIKFALPMDSNGSRIITTTRVQSVAKSCSSHWNDIVYEIRPLSTDDSRRLFYTRIFGSDTCPPHLVQVSEKIYKKFSGVPLAIKTISSLLATKARTEQEWWEVDNSLGNYGAGNTIFEGIASILHVSYCDLPLHLRTCLLYLSLFPQDYVITRDRLVMRWIAEGFIIEEPGRNLKELGESYFNELIERSFIQPVHVGCDGQPEYCRVHDLVHDFVVSKSAEENLAISLGDQEPASISLSTFRCLALSTINEKHHVPDLVAQSNSHIRSLSISGSLGSIPFLQIFSRLRVLDLEDCQNLQDQHFKEIGSLLHLRYLNIRDTPIGELPDQIFELKFLQTLDLRGTQVQEFQSNIVQLCSLAFLLCDSRLRLPVGIGNMKRLSLVSQFDFLRNEIAVVEELGNLSNLTELVIWWSPSLESNNTERYERFASSLYRLNKLQSLSIHGTDSSVDLLHRLYHPIRGLKKFQMNKDCYLSSIPEWLRSLPNLAYVCVDVKEVKNKDLQLLSCLPLLTYLSLSSRVVPTEKLAICSKGFLVLQEFHLHSAWANLTFEPGSMPKIERLLFAFHVLTADKDGFSFSIQNLKHLRRFDARINSEGADASQIKAVEDAIKKAAESHPNRLIANILTLGNLVDNEGRDGARKLVYGRTNSSN